MTPTTNVLPTYQRLRQAQRDVNGRLMKMLSKKAIEESARHLGFFEDGQVIVDTESDMDLVMDTAIYDYYPSNGKNAVERLAAQQDGDAGEKLVLDAMLRSRFTLLEVEKIVAGVGAEVHDLLFDERFLLADVELSHTAHPDLLVATRLLCFEGFVMTTGVNVVFDPGLGATLVQSFSGLAGRASELNLRLSSFLARFILEIGIVEPDEARMMLADIGAGHLPPDDPRRQAYALLRANRLSDV